MPYFIFDKNGTIKAKKAVDEKIKEKLSKISPTPFPLDFEEVEKTITLTIVWLFLLVLLVKVFM